MTTAPETAEGATPDSVDSTKTGAMPVEKPTEASGATPPSESSGLEAALRRERESRKAAEAELKRLRPQATDAETLAVRVAELEQAAERSRLDALRLKIATEYSIPPVLADRMHGQTEDELRADAETLKAAIPAQPTPTTTSVGGPQGPPAAAKSPEEWLGVIRGKR